jgi:ketol-acid reductoisomerase
MTSLTANRSPGTFACTGARIAVLGYDADARDCALALARGGNRVTIGLPLDGAWRIRAEDDGFMVAGAAAAVDGATIVVVAARDPAPVWHASRVHVEPGALVVVSCAYSLDGGVFDGVSTDVALVTGASIRCTPCRIAVHRDVTGRALLRAIGYVHAVYGADMAIEATTVGGEIDRELAGVSDRIGPMLARAEMRRDDDRVTVSDLLGHARSRG